MKELSGLRRSQIIGASRILHFLAQGESSVDIIDSQERSRIFRGQKLEVGERSEQNVFEAISTLPIVRDVVRAKKWSGQDRRGIDMSVYLDKRLSLKAKVKVQVKSSSRGIEEFKMSLARDEGVDVGEIDDWLIKHGWIILNGSLPGENIAMDFLSQLGQINEARQKRDNN